MYRLYRRHGQEGLRGSWYFLSEHETEQEAKQAADNYRASHPESDGWNVDVTVFKGCPTDAEPVYDI